MKYFCIIALFFCVRYVTSQYLSISHKQLKPPCDGPMKNSLVEHFFNIIFTEFQSTPPVCVCVQMCAGQSTYCYPNGCLKRDDLKRVDSPQTHARGDRKQYMFVVDAKNDFMEDFLEKRYVIDEAVAETPVREHTREMRPDPFKDKYNMLMKFKKMPSVELRYNLREQVKNMKSDLLKIETVDLSKTRWPVNKRNLISGHKARSKLEKQPPMIGKANFFMTMLPANSIAGYPPKYFKRDIASLSDTLNEDDSNLKAFYLFENTNNTTVSNASETISIETLIENVIHNSFKIKPDDTENETEVNTEANEAEENKVKEKVDANITNSKNDETVDVISVNFTNEKVDTNKYTDDSVANTREFSKMITNLSKRIEKQNNTSMEIANRLIGVFNKADLTLTSNNTKTLKDKTNESTTDYATKMYETVTANQETTPISVDFKNTMVTKKTRHRRAKKQQNSKIN